MLDQIVVWMDIVTYNPANTLIWKYMWYNQWPYFISSHEQLTKELAIDQDLRDWITKELEFNHLRLPRRSTNALIEEEMKMNLIWRMQHLLSPMNSPFLILPILYKFCNLLLWASSPFPFKILRFTFRYLHSALYFQHLRFLLFTFRHLISCNSHIKFCLAQLEHSSN